MPNFDHVLLDIDGTPYRRTRDAQAMSERVFERAGEGTCGNPNDLLLESSKPPDSDDPIGFHGVAFVRGVAQNDRPAANELLVNDSGAAPDCPLSVGTLLDDGVAGAQCAGLVAPMRRGEAAVGQNKSRYVLGLLSEVSIFRGGT